MAHDIKQKGKRELNKAGEHQKLINYSSKSLDMEEDRISKLPAEILHHILSKIGIKEAVGTSILSKKWRNLWSSLPDLSFSFRLLAYKSGVDCLAYSTFMPRFTHFVLHFLSHRDHNLAIRKFELSSDLTATDSQFIDKCLDYAINHGVQHLNLDAYCHPTPLKFPQRLFSCKTIQFLRLKQYSDSVVIPNPFILPNLKTLYLERFTFKDDADLYSFPKEPFSSFPDLEKLTLYCCEVSGLMISASKLKILEISFHDPLFSREQKIAEISTPMLTSFRYEGYVSLVCSKVDFPSLEEVYFDISPVLESPYTDDIANKMTLNTIGMLQQLGNAKFVTLTMTTIEVLVMDLHLLEQSPSPFPHIKFLKLTKRPYVIYATEFVSSTVMNYLTKGSSYGDSVVLKLTEGIVLAY